MGDLSIGEVATLGLVGLLLLILIVFLLRRGVLGPPRFGGKDDGK